MLLCLATLVAACDKGRPDPKETYAELVKAANKEDGSTMYDLLDSSMRASFDRRIEQQAAMVDQLTPEQRTTMAPDQLKTLEAVKGLKGKQAFLKIMSLNKGMTEGFKGEYKVTKVDTLVVLTVQHGEQPANLYYLRWEDGRYRISEQPQAPQPQMPKGHPQMQQAPPQTAPPSGTAPAPSQPGQPSPSQPSPSQPAPAQPNSTKPEGGKK